jgi:predicted O-methyltransferase YrrM
MFADRLDYIQKTFAPETEAQRKAAGGIAVGPEEGKFLQFLIRATGAKKVLEIGTFNGYSALWMADALPEGGEVVTLEYDAPRAAIARENTAHEPKIRIVAGDALETLPKLRGPFDMAFIDADKIHYLEYLDAVEKLIRKGGLIVADNTFLFDAVWQDGPVDRVRETARAAMRALNKRLADPAKYTGAMLPTEQGMTVAVKLF